MNFSKRFLHTTLCMILILIFLCPTALAAPKLVLADGSAIPTIMPCNSTYTIKDSSSTDVYFKSSDKSIATIGRTSGKLTTLNPGTVTIYSYNKSTDTSRAKLTISVKKRAETIKLNYSKIYFATEYQSSYGSDFAPALTAELGPSDTTDTVRYFSDDSETIGVVRSSGKVLPKKSGSVVITAYSLLHAADDKENPDNITATAEAFAHEHNYQSTPRWTASDSFYHYAKCQNDGCTIVEDTKQRHYGEHNFYNNICRTCGYVRTEIAGHTHSWTSYKYDSSRHWLVCENSECGATKSPEIHNFGSDNKCKVCKMTHEHNAWEEALSLDANAHWNSCQICDARKDMGYHRTDTAGNCQTQYSCLDCGAAYAKGPHIPRDDWGTSDYSHTKRCAFCSSMLSNENHTWVKDTDNTMKCSVCEYTHTHTWGEWTADAGCHSRSCKTQLRNSNGKIIEFENETFEHTFGTDGICTLCKYEYSPEMTDDVYQIGTPLDLSGFARLVNSGKSNLNAILTNDIDCSGTTLVVIGNSVETPFSGTFDGNGKEIKNINLTVSHDNFGLFGTVSGGTVKNLSVSGKISLPGETEYVKIGAVAGAVKNGAVFSGIISSVDISGNAPAKHIGGVVGSSGWLSGLLKIEKCIYSGNINVPNASDCIGGILGYAQNNVQINDCGSTGNVTAKSGGYAGGILGYVNSTLFRRLTNCYAAGKSSGAAIIGAVQKPSLNIEVNFAPAGTVAYGGKYGSAYRALYTDDWFSGHVTYQLNQASCDGTQAWYQDIGKSYPSFSGGTVYLVGNHGDELIYANEKPKAAVVNNGKNIIVLFADSPCMLVVALYKDGKLVDTKTENITKKTSITLDKLGLNTDNSDMVKAMIFKDLNSLEPLSVSSWK